MHRPDIDGLRALAVVAVIMNHIERDWLPNGHLGVDVFFVISGFVITQSLLNRADNSFRDFITGFYRRRVKRLLPALLLVVSCTVIALAFVSPKADAVARASFTTALAAIFGLSNLYLYRNETDYFGATAELNPFTHTWSLGVEEQFYVIFPILFWVTGLRLSARPHKAFIFTMTILLIISLALFGVLSKHNPPAAFYMMPARFWELATGSLLCVLMTKHSISQLFTDKTASKIALLAIAAIVLVLYSAGLPAYKATAVTVICTAIAIATIRPRSSAYRFFTSPPVMYIGLVSYSLYLWHWPILALARWTVGLDLISIIVICALIFALAAATHEWIEKPLRSAEWTFTIATYRVGSTPAITVIALLLAASFIHGMTVISDKGLAFLGNPDLVLAKAGPASLDDATWLAGTLWAGPPCVLTANAEVGKKISLDKCTIGSPSATGRRFLVVGNSFSAAQLEMFEIIALKYGEVTITSSWGASVVPELVNTGPWDKANDYYWSFVIPALIDKLRPGDVLIMVNDMAQFSPLYPTAADQEKLDTLREGVIRIADRMSGRGIAVLMQSGNPFMRETQCTPQTAAPQWWHRGGKTRCVYYSTEQTIKRRERLHSMLLGIENEKGNFFVFDLIPILCPAQSCQFQNANGTLLYRDEWSHLSVEANIIARPHLDGAIQRLLDREHIWNVRN